MKTLKTFATFRNTFFSVMLLGAFFSTAMGSPATKNEGKTDKLVVKTRNAVSNAGPDDWFTLAQAAEKCIKKGVNMMEACNWLDKSMKIRETAYNLTVKGDYYFVNRLPQKALEHYVKAIEVGKADDSNFNPADIQKKIAKIVFKQ